MSLPRVNAVIALLLFSCAALVAHDGLPPASASDSKRAGPLQISPVLRKADAALAHMARQKLFSGAVLVARNGSVLLSKGYGWADRKHHVSNTARTEFRIGTSTNQFTAMAILLLQAKGKLTVRDHVCAYVPRCPKAWRPITIHQLLTHTAGIDNFPTHLDAVKPTSPARLLAAVKATPLIARPGSTWSYSNSGYDVLGYIIEKLSHRSYGSFLQTRIFGPARMSSSAYYPTKKPTNLAVGYSNAYSVAPRVEMSGAFSSAGVYSTVVDLYRWDRALSSASIASPRVVASLFKSYVTICRKYCAVPSLPAETGYKTPVAQAAYGYGWGVARLQPSLHRLYAAAGGFSTGQSYNGQYPDDKVEIIVLTNDDNVDIAQAVRLLQDAVLGAQ
jgi:CubicO group peptidase (beta-lactamase class C family)